MMKALIISTYDTTIAILSRKIGNIYETRN